MVNHETKRLFFDNLGKYRLEQPDGEEGRGFKYNSSTA